MANSMTDNMINIITDILVEHYGCDSDELNADTRFLDIGIDSLDVVEMMVEIEDKVGYEVELTERVETIGTLADFIENNK